MINSNWHTISYRFGVIAGLIEFFSLGVSAESLRAKRDRKSAISLQRVQFDTKFLECDFRRKSAVLRFWDPLWGLRGAYDDHLRLIGKRIVDFLLVLFELFFHYVLRLRRYKRISVENRRIRSNRVGWPRISGRMGRPGPPPPTHSSSQKTRLNDLPYGIKIWTDLSSVLSPWQTERQNRDMLWKFLTDA